MSEEEKLRQQLVRLISVGSALCGYLETATIKDGFMCMSECWAGGLATHVKRLLQTINETAQGEQGPRKDGE